LCISHLIFRYFGLIVDLHKITDMSSTLRKNIDRLRRDTNSLLNKPGQSNSNSKNDNSGKNSNSNSKPSHSNENVQRVNNNFISNASNTLDIIKKYSEINLLFLYICDRISVRVCTRVYSKVWNDINDVLYIFSK
jgi:hypothetical protein